MAFNNPFAMFNLFFFLLLLNFALLPSASSSSVTASFDAIYQFGDSLSDTGNLIREDPLCSCGKPPFGQDLDAKPTGRCSDGLLMVDYFARAFGLPLLNPYLDESADFRHGVNFAVAGSTAMDRSALASLNVTSSVSTDKSLSVQLRWFKAHLRSLCSSSTDSDSANSGSSEDECKRQKLKKALILMGEIGGNDYNYPLMDGKSPHQLYTLVPHVVNTLKDAAQELIDMGATQIVVPGNFPVGCLPAYLSSHGSNDTSMYDELKCLKTFNEFAAFHNDQLKQMLAELRHQNPGVALFYGDYYSAFRWLLRSAASLGYEEEGVFKACCGKGDNAFNLDTRALCGDEGVPVCEDPKKRLSWDGLHLTQQAYSHLAEWLLSDVFQHPPSCSDNLISMDVQKGFTPTY